MSHDHQAKRIETLEVDECMTLLRSERFGRVAYASGDRVEIFPVNGVFVDGAVVFRTDYGDRLDELASGLSAAYEIDDVDRDRGTGWSVVVHGQSEEVSSPQELERLRDLPFEPWAPGRREHFVRLLPQRITGRRITEGT